MALEIETQTHLVSVQLPRSVVKLNRELFTAHGKAANYEKVTYDTEASSICQMTSCSKFLRSFGIPTKAC